MIAKALLLIALGFLALGALRFAGAPPAIVQQPQSISAAGGSGNNPRGERRVTCEARPTTTRNATAIAAP
jgi:hypothetical protein